MKQSVKPALLITVLLLVLLPALPVGANGAPVDIYLSYLPNVSNWGPQGAAGQAVVGVADGIVKLEATGLQHLDGELYQVWLESREERKLYSAGTFNVGDDGVGRLDVLLDDLPYQEYRMLLITVEPDPDPSPDAGEHRSLAGFFPNAAIVQVTEQDEAPAGQGQLAAAQSQPPYLPVTGESPTLPAGLIATFAVMVAFGLLLSRTGVVR